MLHHAGYIASSTKAQAQLVELQRTVESHVAMQRPLSSLLGRLEPFLAPGGGDEDGNGDGDGDENGPVSTYDEGDEDVDVVEDALDDGDDSEDGWETDEDARWTTGMTPRTKKTIGPRRRRRLRLDRNANRRVAAVASPRQSRGSANARRRANRDVYILHPHTRTRRARRETTKKVAASRRVTT